MSNFNTKEDYFKFITAWKAAANHTNCKKHRKVCDHTQYDWKTGYTKAQQENLKKIGYTNVGDYSYTEPGGGHYKTDAWLTGAHFVLRNVLLGKEPIHGFSPKGAKKRGTHESAWLAFEQAAWTVERKIKQAKEYMNTYPHASHTERDKIDDRIGNQLRDFLLPLGAGLTIADLSVIDKDDLRSAWKILSAA